MQYLLEERYLNIYGITDVIDRAIRPPKTYLCGAGRAMVAIDTDGAVFPCQRFIGYSTSDPKWKLGDIWDGFDKERREEFFNLTTQKMKGCKAVFKDSSPGLCKKCDIYKICTGGCPAVNHLETGDIEIASSGYLALKTICIDEVHSIITFFKSKYPEVWEAYVSRSAKSKDKECKPDKGCKSVKKGH